MSHLMRKSPKADLRRTYFINMQLSIILSLIVFIAVFRINFNYDQKINFKNHEHEMIELENIIQTTHQSSPPPPPRPKTPEPVPDDQIIEDDFFDFDFNSEPQKELPPPPSSPETEDGNRIFEIFEIVEDEPYPIGGLESIYNNLEYPGPARRAGIEGLVILQFVVDQNGKLNDFTVIRDIGGGAAEAAINAIQGTDWEPGRQRGRAVPVRFQIPITFELKSR